MNANSMVAWSTSDSTNSGPRGLEERICLICRFVGYTQHVHDVHRLAWPEAGVVLMVEVDDRYWVLPPNLAL